MVFPRCGKIGRTKNYRAPSIKMSKPLAARTSHRKELPDLRADLSHSLSFHEAKNCSQGSSVLSCPKRGISSQRNHTNCIPRSADESVTKGRKIDTSVTRSVVAHVRASRSGAKNHDHTPLFSRIGRALTKKKRSA